MSLLHRVLPAEPATTFMGLVWFMHGDEPGLMRIDSGTMNAPRCRYALAGFMGGADA